MTPSSTRRCSQRFTRRGSPHHPPGMRMRACRPPPSWSPGGSPPTHPDPICDIAPGSRSGGRQVPRHSPGSHPACEATSRDRPPRVACSGNRLLHCSCCFPLPLTGRPRRAIWRPDHRGTLRRNQHVPIARTKSAAELDGSGRSQLRQRDRLGRFQQSRRIDPTMSDGARSQGQRPLSRLEMDSCAQPVEAPMGQAERLPCYAHCHCHGDRPVRAPIPDAPDHTRSRRTKVSVRSGRGMGAVKRISHVEAKPTRCCLSAGNGICRALSSSAWRFWTRILAPT